MQQKTSIQNISREEPVPIYWSLTDDIVHVPIMALSEIHDVVIVVVWLQVLVSCGALVGVGVRKLLFA
jgi:hypothetical protein